MSKKTFFLIVILMLLGGFAVWYFYIRGGEGTPAGTVAENTDQNLFPFGKNPTPVKPDRGEITIETEATTTETVVDNSPVPRLRQLAIEPISGATFVATGTTTSIRFVDRATGHISEIGAERNDGEKISSVTIPKVYEALFSQDGNKVIFRYVQEDDMPIKSFYAAISTTSKPEEALEGAFLADGIKDLSVLGNKIFYLNRGTNGSQILQADINGGAKVSVYSSAFDDWSLSVNNLKKAFLYTKPSGTTEGFGYILDIQKGTAEKVTKGVSGLTGTINPAGDFVFLSAVENGSIASGSYIMSSSTVATLSIKTLSDKCAWSNVEKEIIYCGVPTTIQQGTYPDDWYKGIVSFSDLFWKVNVKTGETDLILNATKGNNFDMTNLKLSKDDRYLIFTNKKDQTLWEYKIKE